MKIVRDASKIILLVLALFSTNALACSEGPGTAVRCFECDDADEIAAALESQVLNAESTNFSLGQLRVILVFSTMGFNSAVAIPINKFCDQSWEEAVQNGSFSTFSG